MSVNLVKNQVNLFLKSSEPEVMAINGLWGIGKTYSWNKFIVEFKEDIAFKTYAYVSLFGVNSLEELKRAIFNNTLDTKIVDQKPGINTFRHNYQSIAKQLGRKSTDYLKVIAKPLADVALKGLGSGLENAFDSISFLSLNKSIICFDDIERHSAGLNIKDFLGLVSFLKEQKDCKVVILLNEDAKDLTDYFKYKEKIIDKQLHFDPSAEECFDLAIEDQEQYQYIRECCLKLNIKNIRVLKKIERHIQNVLSPIGSYHEEIKSQTVQSAIIFCWCYYTRTNDDSIPDFNFLKQKGIREAVNGIDEDVVKRWNAKLNDYGYLYTDELDIVIAESIEQGFVDTEKWFVLCNARQNELEAKERCDELSKAWDLFHSSFDDNTDEIIAAFEKGLKISVKDLSCSQYSKSVQLIRQLGDTDTADDLINYYIDAMKDKPEMLNMDSMEYHPFGVEGEEFRSKLQDAYNQVKQVQTPIIILERWRKSNSWNKEDADILAVISKDDLKKMFKSFKAEDLVDYIRVCLKLGISNDILLKNTRNALQEIGEESPLNQQRLSKFEL
ncbi:hypothetical protein [Colwellia sp. Bg11-12]|uniref:hypothetical protein n=1 Tax=Colwellia sp. Bg11-12 TaxID=2759817 RepID=UPI0015F5556A|nr:hypothetical protein [Colwellia sp. Bg11-12]MBA6262166.1 hypothetical protein [Colwellia sp. Bg11-12]